MTFLYKKNRFNQNWNFHFFCLISEVYFYIKKISQYLYCHESKVAIYLQVDFMLRNVQINNKIRVYGTEILCVQQSNQAIIVGAIRAVNKQGVWLNGKLGWQ